MSNANGSETDTSAPRSGQVDRAAVDDATHQLLATLDKLASEMDSSARTRPAAVLDSSLTRELALDSLARVELGARLEREFDISLNENALFEADSPRDLLRLIIKAHAGAPLTLRTPSTQASALPAVGVPQNATTLSEMLEWHVTAHSSRPHIQFYDDYSDGEILSYADVYNGAAAVAGTLQQRGLQPGEPVALMLPTGRDYFLAFYGVVLAGGIPVPIYPPVRRQQLEDHLRRQSRILTNCRAVMLVTSAEALTVARLLTASVDSLREVLASETLAGGRDAFVSCTRRAQDIAFLQYTSGSTGDPKGVCLSHNNLLANIRADGRGMGVTSEDVFVSWLPLYHDMGLIGAWLGSLYHSVRLVVMPPLSFLARPERWLWAMHRHAGTLSAAPNFAFELCLKRISDDAIVGLDLSGWRIAANGAEAISVDTMERFCERFAAYGFGRTAMFPVYGLAECAVGLAFTPLGRGPLVDVVDRLALTRDGEAKPAAAEAAAHSALKLVSCGVPLAGHEIRIVDTAGRELPERHEGSLQFRGPSATNGYFERAEATAALLVDDWLVSGDRAYLAAGELYITGRSKDMIIRAGRNLYPPELEDAVGELDGIRKGHVAVFGVHDASSGTERVVILAETRKRGDAARAALTSQINALATDLFDGPADDIVFALPNTVLRTSSGKIRRAACRERYEQGDLDRHERKLWLQLLRLGLTGTSPQLRRGWRNLRERLFAVWSWSVFAMLASCAWSLMWLPLPRRLLWRGARALAGLLGVFTATPLIVHGREHLPQEGQPCVLVSNHQSYLDGILLLAMLPRPPRFLIKGELKRSRLLARPLTRLGALFVERFDAGAGIASMRDTALVLQQGELLVVFPEGTFKRMPGLLPFHLGAFTTAAENSVAIIPVAIRGTRSVLRADSWFPRRGSIEVTLGTPLSSSQAESTWQQALHYRDAARAHILQYSGEPDLAHESNVVDSAP